VFAPFDPVGTIDKPKRIIRLDDASKSGLPLFDACGFDATGGIREGERIVMGRALTAAVLGFACVFATSARANDSTAEIALGGLTFTKSDAISMDSEDLYISRDRVRVKYRFTNTTDAPIDALVAFPLPEIPPGTIEDETIYWGDPVSGLKFTTSVDGQLLAL
jgi:hypothetical protein